MKFKFLTPLVFVAVLAVSGVVYASNRSPASDVSSKPDSKCTATKNKHTIQISDTTIMPQQTEAQVCDQVIFTVGGHGYHMVAFGPHAHHIEYPGLTDTMLAPGQNQTLTLVSKGTFEIHDHMDDNLKGNITIK